MIRHMFAHRDPDRPANVDAVTVHAADVAARLRALLPGAGDVKIHKLLYYVQGHHLAWHGRPAFTETIEAWVNGRTYGAATTNSEPKPSINTSESPQHSTNSPTRSEPNSPQLRTTNAPTIQQRNRATEGRPGDLTEIDWPSRRCRFFGSYVA
jgi:hypothetical protein